MVTKKIAIALKAKTSEDALYALDSIIDTLKDIRENKEFVGDDERTFKILGGGAFKSGVAGDVSYEIGIKIT